MPVTLDSTSYSTMASSRKQFLILPVNQENTLQNTIIYWEEEVFPFATYTIRTGGTNIRPVGVWNGHWYTLEWDNKQFPYFHEALPDINNFNKKSNGRAPNDYEDIPSFTATQSPPPAEQGEEENEKLNSKGEDPEETDQQICNSPIEVTANPEQTPQVQPTQTNPTMSVAAMAITQTYAGRRGGPPDPRGGGPSNPGGGGGGPPGGGPPGPPGGGAGGMQPQQANQGDSKLLRALPIILEGDCTKLRVSYVK
jgi:hypothetical protein